MTLLYLSHVMTKPAFAECEQQRRRSACASAKSDKRLSCSLPGWHITSTCYSQNCKTLASFSSSEGRFGSYMVENPEDRFSCDEAHFIKVNVFLQMATTLYSVICLYTNSLRYFQASFYRDAIAQKCEKYWNLLGWTSQIFGTQHRKHPWVKSSVNSWNINYNLLPNSICRAFVQKVFHFAIILQHIHASDQVTT